MSILFIDTETDGLPPMRCRDYLNPKKYKTYCRVIELNWVVMNDKKEKQTMNKNIIDKNNEDKMKTTLNNLYEDIKKYNIKKVVGYNVLFHLNVILSEAYRFKNKLLINELDFINKKVQIKPICSMKMAIVYMDIEDYKFPKLDELYYLFFKKEKEGNKLSKNINCFYKIKTLKKNKDKALKYGNKYKKYVNKLKKMQQK